MEKKMVNPQFKDQNYCHVVQAGSKTRIVNANIADVYLIQVLILLVFVGLSSIHDGSTKSLQRG
jgi:hypothetical protein